jgi:hypothetical protein
MKIFLTDGQEFLSLTINELRKLIEEALKESNIVDLVIKFVERKIRDQAN